MSSPPRASSLCTGVSYRRRGAAPVVVPVFSCGFFAGGSRHPERAWPAHARRRSHADAGTALSEVSTAQTEALDERTVALDVDALQVPQEAAATADEQEQTTTGVVVVRVLAAVLG